MSLLEVNDLCVRFETPDGPVAAVSNLGFSLERGQTLGLVGESGSGKSQSMLAVMGLLAHNGRASGQALFGGYDLLALPAAALNRLRGDRIAMVFQDPMTSLNPYLTVARQMTEVLELHRGLSRRAALALCIAALESVQIPDAARRIHLYPHEFSGGMRQRVMIAMALLCKPDVLIADEPTTALDVTVQAQIIGLLRALQRDHGTAIVMISHDLGVVAGLCDEVMVLYSGCVVEQAGVNDIFYRPTHPYTVGLLGAVPHLSHGDDEPLASIPGAPPDMSQLPPGCAFAPRCALAASDCVAQRPALLPAGVDAPGVLRACLRSAGQVQALRAKGMTGGASATSVASDTGAPLLSVRELQVHFKLRRRGAILGRAATLRAVNGISFDLHAGETLGIVGESGCGKSTLARALLNLVPAAAGSIRWQGQEMVGASDAAWQAVRQHAQMVFQDPLGSLDPRMNVAQIIGEPLRTHRAELSSSEVLAQVSAIMARVGLNDSQLYRYPHEFSGGQCQRIAIARALILKPRVVVCDEPLSALDVSIQAQIIELLKELQAEMGLALIFIAHDLAVVKRLSQRVLVMYLGRAMELADRQALYAEPRHPYTRALLSAVPMADPIRERGKAVELLQGELPSPLSPPSGCVFRTRCPLAIARCADEVPPLRPIAPGTQAACLLA